MILYIDMDDTIVNFTSKYKEVLEQNPDIEYPQSTPGFFKDLEPLPGAVESITELTKRHDVHILTAPSVLNPLCYTEKRLSVEKLFGIDMCKNLIIARDKSLLRGHILIDDTEKANNQHKFKGLHMRFGAKPYKDWPSVMHKISRIETMSRLDFRSLYC